MDLSFVIISGILGLGYFLNKDGKEKRNNIQLNSRVPKNQQPLSYDNYYVNNYEKIKQFEKNIADNLDNRSLHFEETGIVFPEIYQDERILPVLSNKDINIKPNNSNFNLEHFSNNPKSKTNLNDFYKINQNKKFGHKNPYPFMKKNQGYLFRETMSTEDAYKSKQEVSSFNVPLNNSVSPSFMDTMDNKVERSKATITNLMNGIKLMQPIIEAPNTSGNPDATWEGKNPTFRGYEPSVDELRNLNNQKQDLSSSFKSVGSFYAQKPTLVQNETRRIKQKDFNIEFNHKLAKSNVNQATLRPEDQGIYETQRSNLSEQNYSSCYNPKSMTFHDSQFKGSNNLRGNETDYMGNVFNSRTKSTIQNRLKPKTTLKETLHMDYTGNAAIPRHDGYKIAKQLNHNTIRSTIENEEYTTLGSVSKKQMTRDNQYNSDINALKSIVEKSYRPPVPEGQKLPGKTDETDFENFRSIRGKIGNVMNIGNVNGRQVIKDRICKQILTKTNKVREINYESTGRLNPLKGKKQIVDNPYIFHEKSY